MHREKANPFHYFLLLLFILVLPAVACGGSKEAEKAVAPTNTSVPVSVPAEGKEPGPTATPRPSPIPEPTATPKPVEPGHAYHSPASVGTSVQADDKVEVTVLEVERQASDRIVQENMFNEPPAEGEEYIMAKAKVKYYGASDKTVRISPMTFRVTGSKGVLYDAPMLVINDELEGEIFGGGELQGWLAFAVMEGEENLMLIYDPGLGSRAIWLALGEVNLPVVAPIEAAESAEEHGLAKGSPAALGQPVLAENGLELSVLEVRRQAYPLVSEMNSLNPEPEEGEEYVLARVRVRYTGGKEDTLRVSEYHLRVTGEKGAIYESPMMLMLEPAIDAELFAGGAWEGWAGWQVPQGEGGLIAIYDPGAGVSARWLSLEE